jgi:hypothetical protein
VQHAEPVDLGEDPRDTLANCGNFGIDEAPVGK